MDTLIPFDSLEPDTLEKVLEDIVSRDGTDYGDYDLTVSQKCAQALAALRRKEAYLIFDTESETIKLVAKNQLDQYS